MLLTIIIICDLVIVITHHYDVCFRSKKHQLHKSSAVADNTYVELNQCNIDAIANPNYANIEGLLDEDVHAKIQDDEGIKTGTQGSATMEAATEEDEDTVTQKESTDNKDEDIADSAVNNMNESEFVPVINTAEGRCIDCLLR
jgi:hypothetical protein